jgi:hypothetical protein
VNSAIKKPRLWKRVIKYSIILLLLITIFIIWTQFYYKADPIALQQFLTQNKDNLTVTEHSQYWEISRSNSTSTTGYIFYPGAKVDSQAYFYKLGTLVNEPNVNIKLFITKPLFHLAVFGINQADAIIENNPNITDWILGGHSLGGAMSCEYAKSNTQTIKTLILLGSYCASDLSATDLKVISIHGSLDGVLSSEEVLNNRKNLPQNNSDFIIDGMNHAQAGNYGNQSGDNSATKPDEAVKEEITSILKKELF